MDEEGEGSKRRVRGLIQTYKANRKGLKLLSKACKREKVQKRCRKRTEGFCRWLGIWGGERLSHEQGNGRFRDHDQGSAMADRGSRKGWLSTPEPDQYV